MLRRIRRLPSPAFVISVIALIVALGAGTFAVAALSNHDKKVVKRIATGAANKQIKKKVPGVTVKHARFARNAGHLGGLRRTDFEPRGGAGVAYAGAKVTAAGQVTSWYETYRGCREFCSVGVSHPSAGIYSLHFPLGSDLTDPNQAIVQATLQPSGSGGEIEADLQNNGGIIDPIVETFDSAGHPADHGFSLVLYHSAQR